MDSDLEYYITLLLTAVIAIGMGYLLGKRDTVDTKPVHSVRGPADRYDRYPIASASSAPIPPSISNTSSSNSSSSSSSSLAAVSSSSASSSSSSGSALADSPESVALSGFGPPDLTKVHGRVIIVAKQLPVSVKKSSEGKWVVEWDDHRNFIANLRVLTGGDNRMDVKWVGYVPDIAKADYEEVETLLEDYNCVPVFLDKDLARRFFHGFCKGIMWPLLHYVTPKSENFGEKWDDCWQAYTAANNEYAKVVQRTRESQGDFVWIHNYHLLLCPSFLRKNMQRAHIGLFIHTPFPSSDVFRLLPSRNILLSSIMQSDMIGFHTFDYARHFLSAIKRVMDLDYETLPGGMLGIKYSGRFVALLISHVGVDAVFFNETSKDEKVLKRVAELRAQTGGRHIILGTEELDSIKEPTLKISAFGRFLQKYGYEWKDKVVLVDVVPPAGSNEEMLAVKKQINSHLQSIQAEFGKEVVQLIDYGESKLTNAEMVNDMVAAYRAANVGLISTFWDGLNMTPYEFTAAQDPNEPGSLIVSEFMGCSRSLNGVQRVNPWALDPVAEAIHQCLNATLDERCANHQRRYNYVMNHTVEKWAVGFLQYLDRAAKLGSSLNFVQVGFGSSVRLVGVRSDFTHLDESQLTIEYRKSSRRVLLLDYDGTLTSAEKSAQRSKFNRPSPIVLRLLKTLTDDKDNFVFIMSGRTRDTLGEWFHELKELGLTAEKGLFIKWPERMTQLRKQMIQEKKMKERNNRLENGEEKIVEEEEEEKSSRHADGNGSSHLIEEEELEWEAMIALDSMTWKSLALETIKAYTEMTDGSWIEDKEYAIVWHYEQADPEYGRLQASELEKYLVRVLNSSSVDVVKYDYNRILEVKPHGVNKGVAATVILESVNALIQQQLSQSNDALSSPRTSATSTGAAAAGGGSPQIRRPSVGQLPASHTSSGSALLSSVSPSSVHPLSSSESVSLFIFAAGDDRSDEDMFLAVQNRDDLKKKRAEKDKDLSIGMKKKVLSNRNLASMDEGGSFSQPPATSPSSAAHTDLAAKKQTDPNVFTVCVGMKPSNAHYYLHDDEEVIKALHSLATASHLMNLGKLHGASAPILPDVQRSPPLLPTLSTLQPKQPRKTLANQQGKGGLGGMKKANAASLSLSSMQ